MMRPDFIGVDNIFELFTKKKVRDFFFRLPDKTKMLQVNGALERQEPPSCCCKKAWNTNTIS